MFDNYPPGISPNNNQPTGQQAVDMYAQLDANAARAQAPLANNQNYTSMPNLGEQMPVASGGSFKFLIIGLVTLVLVLGGAFAAYQMILKPKFENANVIISEEPMINNAVVEDMAQVNNLATSSDSQISYVSETSVTSSTESADAKVMTSTSVELVAQPVEVDSDKDGLMDDLETLKGTNKNLPDTDGDLLLDGEELYSYSTDPLKLDTDGDTLSDGEEVKKYQTKPLVADTDSDGFSDGEEVKNNYNPLGSGRLILSN